MGCVLPAHQGVTTLRQRALEANREVILVLALLADDSPCAPAKSTKGVEVVYDLSTDRQRG
jgi:hypothetical protein